MTKTYRYCFNTAGVRCGKQGEGEGTIWCGEQQRYLQVIGIQTTSVSSNTCESTGKVSCKRPCAHLLSHAPAVTHARTHLLIERVNRVFIDVVARHNRQLFKVIDREAATYGYIEKLHSHDVQCRCSKKTQLLHNFTVYMHYDIYTCTMIFKEY